MRQHPLFPEGQDRLPEGNPRLPEGDARSREGLPGLSERLQVTAIREPAAFARARRHSLMVRVLRVVLPAGVLLAAGGAFSYSFIFSYAIGPVQYQDVKVEADALVMHEAHLSGVQSNGQPYEMTAAKATQSTTQPHLISLEGIDATIAADGGETARVKASAGNYDSDAAFLRLSDGITVTTESGMEATLDEAEMNLQTGRIVSSRPVEVSSADRTINANEVEIEGGGKSIRFRRGVRMTLHPNAGPAGAAPAVEAAGSR